MLHFGMLPTGRVIEAWRQARQLSQAELAKRAGIPRPNLSVLERGGRDVKLSTLRSIALALEINPGTLVDGILPKEFALKRWSRKELDKIARSAAGVPVKFSNLHSCQASQAVQQILKQKIGGTGYVLPRRGKRDERTAYAVAQRYFSDAELNNLLSRVLKIRSTK